MKNDNNVTNMENSENLKNMDVYCRKLRYDKYQNIYYI